MNMPTMESVSRFKAAMDSDRGALGPFMICTDPAMVEAAGRAGYDFVLLDMEHGTTTFQTLPNLIRAANVTGVCPVGLDRPGAGRRRRRRHDPPDRHR